MARIAGVDLPRDKQVHVGLTYIYGIGRALAARILTKAGVSPSTRVKDLREDENQTARRHRVLSGAPAPPWAAGARATNQNERTDTKRA